MFALFILIPLALGVWWVFAPAHRFVHGFAGLLDAASRPTLLTLVAGASSVTGRFKNRDVSLRLEHPVDETPGRVIVSMSARASDSAAWKDSSATARDPELSRATFDLEGRYGLILTMEGGSLQAVWGQSPGRFFPGPFDEDRWRNTLSQMHALAGWLERREAQ